MNHAKLAIVVIFLAGSASGQVPTISEKTGGFALDEGQKEELVFVAGIIRMYEYSLKKDPKDLKLRKRFVMFLDKTGQYSRALEEAEAYQKMTTPDPKFRELLTRLRDVVEKQNVELKLPVMQDQESGSPASQAVSEASAKKAMQQKPENSLKTPEVIKKANEAIKKVKIPK